MRSWGLWCLSGEGVKTEVSCARRVDLTLQIGNALEILTGILRPGPSADRARCRVLEFAEEFCISVSYDPFLLGERRGG